MKILLTGASGCVGHALLAELISAGHEAIVLARNSAEFEGKRAQVIVADLTQNLPNAQLPAEIDAVLHVAQSRRYRDFPAGADDVFQINTAATHALVDYARQAKAKSFVFTSTGSVYVPQHDPVSEEATTSPASFYPASKLAAEALLAPYANVLPVAILRLFYVYGPHQSKMLVDGLADRIRSGTAVTVQGDSGIRIAPTYSGDVAQILRQAAESSWKGTFNVGSPNIVHIKALAEEIASVVGVEAKFEHVDGQVPLTPLPSLSKLAGVFDIGSFTPLKTGLKRTFQPAAS